MKYDYTQLGAPQYRTPEGYEVTESGVIHVVETRTGTIEHRASYAPIVPVACWVDPDGVELVELAWRHRGRVVCHTVPRSVAKSGKRLITALGDAAVPATESEARALERWLASIEAANASLVPYRQLRRHLGWQSDGSFVSAASDAERVEPPYREQLAALETYGAAGTAQGWVETIKRLETYPIPRACLAAGLAAPLLRLLGLRSYTLDVSGRSSRGKTTAAMAALSPWGDPARYDTWRTSLIAVEKRLHLVRGLPVVLDETRALKYPDLVNELLYQLSMDQGTARGAGWASQLPWSTILVSTGEQPALSYTTHEGASARTLSVSGAPFGADGERSAAAAIATRDGLTQNYGHAGPAYVARLSAELERGPGHAALLRSRHQDLIEQLGGDTDISRRRAPLLAALALAEQLAHEWGILPYPPMPAETWRGLLAAEAATDNRAEMALDVLREYIAGHGHELWSIMTGPDDRAPHAGWLGKLDGSEVALLPQRVRKILDAAGYTLDAVLPGWLEADYLVQRASQRPSHLVPRRLDSRLARMLVFRSDVLNPKDVDSE